VTNQRHCGPHLAEPAPARLHDILPGPGPGVVRHALQVEGHKGVAGVGAGAEHGAVGATGAGVALALGLQAERHIGLVVSVCCRTAAMSHFLLPWGTAAANQTSLSGQHLQQPPLARRKSPVAHLDAGAPLAGGAAGRWGRRRRQLLSVARQAAPAACLVCPQCLVDGAAGGADLAGGAVGCALGWGQQAAWSSGSEAPVKQHVSRR
jgi:hypothetical protein